METELNNGSVIGKPGRGAAMRKTGDLVRALRKILCDSDVKGPENAARFIIEQCFDGSIEKYRAMEPASMSLRDIANHPDSDWKKGTVHNWLRVYDFCEVVGRRDWVLGFTHLCAVAGLSDRKVAVDLLDEAEAKNWTTRQLREEVKAHVPRRRSGRKADLPYVRTMRTIAKALAGENALAGLEEAVARDNITATLIAQIEAAEALVVQLRRLVPRERPHAEPGGHDVPASSI